MTPVYPAGHPAAVLAYALAPQALAGWTRPPPAGAGAHLAAGVVALPVLPRLPAPDGVDDIRRSGAGLVVDVGRTDGRRTDALAAQATEAGVPLLALDGRLSATPDALLALGGALGCGDRAAGLASMAAQVLKDTRGAGAGMRVFQACGPDGLETPTAGSAAVELFDHLGVELLAPEGPGMLAPVTAGAVRRFDPDWVLALDPAALPVVAASPDWLPIPAVQAGRLRACPPWPFPWLDRPPGINRLMGLVWLAGLLGGDERWGLAEAERVAAALFPRAS